MRTTAWLILFGAGLIAIGCVGPVDALSRSPDVNGGRLYRVYCASCHGDSGRGDGPDASIFEESPRDLRAGLLNEYTKEEMVRRVREGRALALVLDRPALRAHANDVEGLVAYLRRLPTVDWPRAQEGHEIYADRCTLCHGQLGRPLKTLPPGVRVPRDLSDPKVQGSIRDSQLITLVRHGRKGMPALTPRVPEAEGPPLAAFVRLLSPGFALYERYCANCHGDDGHPVSSAGEVMHFPAVVFDRAYLAAHDAEALRAKVWHMLAEQKPAMPHYRWMLDDAQVGGIIDYLKSLK